MHDPESTGEEIIFALSSSPPPARVMILRLDGQGSIGLLNRCLSSGSLIEPRTPARVQIRWGQSDFPIPAVAVSWAKGNSWTGNEGVELFLPGGQPILEGVLGRFADEGARAATPGEFTRRAFLNGKIDLSRAESVATVIEAEDRTALAAARRVLSGELAQNIDALSRQLIDIIALLEAGLDFSEQEVESPSGEVLEQLLQPAEDALDSLLDRRRWPRSGPGVPRVLLWGWPNAGKSSLLNILVGEDLAITSVEAGTTTDVVRGLLDNGDQALEILDLPGDREPGGEIERLALKRARDLICGDDAILWVVDGRRSVDSIKAEYQQLPEDIKDRCLKVLTHLDQRTHLHEEFGEAFWVSSSDGEGVNSLRSELFKTVQLDPGEIHSAALRFTRRQWHLLERCKESLQRARRGAMAGPELLVADLREAQQWLSEISGEATPEEVLDRIFAKFCLGK